MQNSAKKGICIEDIHNIFCAQKQQLKRSVFKRMTAVLGLENSHITRLYLAKRANLLTNVLIFKYFVICCFASVIVFWFSLIWAIQQHNQAQEFGGAACVSGFFWSEDNCKVLF